MTNLAKLMTNLAKGLDYEFRIRLGFGNPSCNQAQAYLYSFWAELDYLLGNYFA